MEAAKQCDKPMELATANWLYGFALLFYSDLDGAEDYLHEGLAQARSMGDAILILRSVTYLTITYRRGRNQKKTTFYAKQTLELAQEKNLAAYVGTAEANLGWIAYTEGDTDLGRTLCLSALERWGSSIAYPLHWTAILPLVAIGLDAGEEPKALSQRLSVLLETEQQKLPVELESAIRTANAARTDDAMRKEIRTVATLARVLGYL